MEPTAFEQVLSTIGAVMVLGAYVANLAGRLDRDGALYALANLLGSSVLAYVAIRSGSLGLSLIEVSWAVVSAVALVRARLPRAAGSGRGDQ